VQFEPPLQATTHEGPKQITLQLAWLVQVTFELAATLSVQVELSHAMLALWPVVQVHWLEFLHSALHELAQEPEQTFWASQTSRELFGAVPPSSVQLQLAPGLHVQLLPAQPHAGPGQVVVLPLQAHNIPMARRAKSRFMCEPLLRIKAWPI
jgi:hypothetical protein